MKRLNICKFIFIINLLILPVVILFNINLNNEMNVVKEEKTMLQEHLKNNNNTETIDCSYILESLGKNPYISVKSIENEKNNIYVNLNYCGDRGQLKKFLEQVNSSKNFKSIKNLNIKTKNIKNNNDENQKTYNKDNDEKINNIHINEEEKQVDITLEYIKNIN